MTYQEKLDALQKANPTHPLLRVFAVSRTPINAILLTRELDKTKVVEVEKPVVVEEEEDDPDQDEDETLRRLRIQQSNLFVDRRKLSNSFHECANDRQRRIVSEKIQIVQRRIEMVRAEIRQYKELGYLPEPDEKYPIPEDTFRLIALRDSLRASISRKKREIEHIGREIEEKDADAPARLEKAEAKLKDLKTHLEHVKKAIADRNLQP